MVKTYIHSNDYKPINTKQLSPPSPTFLFIINVFEKNNSTKQKNNYSVNSFVSNNSLDNYLTESLNSTPTPFSSVFFKHESEQHLDSEIVFSPLPLLISTTSSHPLKVDSSTTDTDLDFEDLIFHLAYGSSLSSSSLSPPTNIQPVNNNS
jgi:hypothetical protein